MLVIPNNDMHPLVAALTVLASSFLFLILTVAEVATNDMSRSIMRSIPSREFSVGNLPELERLGSAFESDGLLSQGVVPPLREQDCPEVVV